MMRVLQMTAMMLAASNPSADSEDADILAALRNGDEEAFAKIVDLYSGPLLRLAMAYVPSRAVAEEVVQETWLGVFEGISRFEGRSSLKTWLFKILTNRAKTRGQRESRYEGFADKSGIEGDEDSTGVDADWFIRQTGHWVEPPHAWDQATPERLALSKESGELIETAIAGLPSTQQQVMTLRDMEGLSSQEVCNILDITETNQRVLLHRARSRVRRALAQYVQGSSE